MKTEEMKKEELEAEKDEKPEKYLEKYFEAKKNEITEDFNETAEKVTGFIGKAAKDVGDFAEEQFNVAKNIFEKVNNGFNSSRSQQILDKYRPIFADEIDGKFPFPNIINVIDYDKRKDIQECQGALGFQKRIKDTDVLEVYSDTADQLDITFYPEKTISAYYVHPLDKDTYIEISEYFKYLKEARIAELKTIAQALGASHFKVSIMEESRAESIKKAKADSLLGFRKDKASASVSKDDNEKKYDFIGVASESYYKGKAPVRPELKYWASNATIKTLVEQRLSNDNPLISETYRLDYNTSTGIKEKEAAKIDGVLKVLKFKGAGNITEEVKQESKKRFEYTVDFE